jgi:hypothetical protein
MMNTNSMPSAHAANWSLLLELRRSIIAKAFADAASLRRASPHIHGRALSRDVLDRDIIGAGHAVASLWLLNSAWQWAGPKWFEAAWKAMPSLLQPRQGRI